MRYPTATRYLAALAFATAFTVATAFAVRAADTNGPKQVNGLTDLEERVAELEATVAKKGNRKMTLVVYGQVNKALLWHDAFNGFTGKDSKGIIDNTNSPTLLGVTGSGKISPAWSAGYRVELQLTSGQPTLTSATLNNEVEVRQANAWLDGPVGKFTVGKASMATDGVGEVTTANTLVAAKLLSLEPMSSNVLFRADLPYDGPRRDLVRWDSPAYAGFIVSASYSSGAGVSPLGLGVVAAGDKDAYDVALRYANEAGGFRVAGAIGFRQENYLVPILPLPFPTTFAGRDKVYVGSASVMHLQTGLFANIAAGLAKAEFGPGGPDHNTVHGQAGWEKNVTGFGATTVYAEAGRLHADGLSGTPKMLGAGVVQRIDSAAIDLYASFRQYDPDLGGDKINVFMAGTRVQF